jgi:hypothetical protein
MSDFCVIFILLCLFANEIWKKEREQREEIYINIFLLFVQSNVLSQMIVGGREGVSETGTKNEGEKRVLQT